MKQLKKQPTNAVPMIGRVFGRLTVIERVGETAQRQIRWLCKCSCGGSRTTTGDSLRRSATLSCGCLQSERTRKTHTKHGAATRRVKSSEYIIWQAMKRRCESQDDPNFHHYGGRGIVVDPAWSADFSVFIADIGPRPSRKHSIDRIDNNGNYEPGNCRWATQREQSRNKRTNQAVMRDDGVVYSTIVEAAEAVGVHPTGISAACRGSQATSGGFRWWFYNAALLRALESQEALPAPPPQSGRGPTPFLMQEGSL